MQTTKPSAIITCSGLCSNEIFTYYHMSTIGVPLYVLLWPMLHCRATCLASVSICLWAVSAEKPVCHEQQHSQAKTELQTSGQSQKSQGFLRNLGHTWDGKSTKKTSSKVNLIQGGKTKKLGTPPSASDIIEAQDGRKASLSLHSSQVLHRSSTQQLVPRCCMFDMFASRSCGGKQDT